MQLPVVVSLFACHPETWIWNAAFPMTLSVLCLISHLKWAGLRLQLL